MAHDVVANGAGTALAGKLPAVMEFLTGKLGLYPLPATGGLYLPDQLGYSHPSQCRPVHGGAADQSALVQALARVRHPRPLHGVPDLDRLVFGAAAVGGILAVGSTVDRTPRAVLGWCPLLTAAGIVVLAVSDDDATTLVAAALMAVPFWVATRLPVSGSARHAHDPPAVRRPSRPRWRSGPSRSP